MAPTGVLLALLFAAVSSQMAYVETPTSFVSAGASGTVTLNGFLSMPATVRTNETLWGCVIIHGTGPIDENGTIAENGVTWRIYRDIALYLSSFGNVVVLRHVKRDYLTPPPNANTELVSDYVTDAVNAMTHLQQLQPSVSQLVFIGHSLGGTLHVHAASKVLGVTKILSLQGAFNDTICPTLMDQYARDGTSEQQMAIAQICAQMLALPGLGNTAQPPFPWNPYVTNWNQLCAEHIPVLQGLLTAGLRALALNSPTDFQIPPPNIATNPEAGYGNLKTFYLSNPNCTFIEFPNIVHFMSPYENTAPTAPTDRVCSAYLAEVSSCSGAITPTLHRRGIDSLCDDFCCNQPSSNYVAELTPAALH